MSMPLFTIVIMIKDLPHLLPFTMESILGQSFNDYEIIVIDQTNQLDIIDPYKERIAHAEEIQKQGLGALMQAGFLKAKGKYLNFLYPGDFYLSSEGLAFLAEHIKEHKESIDLIYCSFLQREIEEPPYAVKFPFTKQWLLKGQLPSRFQSCWISKSLIEKCGGFDHRYKFRPSLNLFSQIYILSNYNKIELSRVLVDYEIRKKPTTDIFRRFLDSYLVVFRNFGFLSSIRWLLTQNYVALLQSLYNIVRKAFLHP